MFVAFVRLGDERDVGLGANAAENLPKRPAARGGEEDRMTPRQIALVRRSWQRVLPIADAAGELFYRRMFELEPSLAGMFSVGVAEQGRKLMDILGIVVARLDRLDELVPAVRELGRRHATYGVERKHYDIGGIALLDTLRAGLGDELSGETAEAWAVAYATLAGVMQDATAAAA